MKSLSEDVIWGVICCNWVGFPPVISNVGEKIGDSVMDPLNVL